MHACEAVAKIADMIETKHAILTTEAMRRADAHAIAHGQPGITLMRAAGQGMADAICKRYAPRPAVVLCGPGNNGGDGWVVASELAGRGWPIRVFSMVERASLRGDAAQAARAWTAPVELLESCDPSEFGLVVDALFGAGLSRPLEGEVARLVEACSADAVIVSADVPSGLDGESAQPNGPVFNADLTVTFHRLKPAHLLQPGRTLCGEVDCIDIGIPDSWADEVESCALVNHPELWGDVLQPLKADTHKHARGRLSVLSGPAGAVGAARLSAQAGLIGGAGFVTLLATKGLVHDLAMADPALVVRAYDPEQEFGDCLAGHKADAAVLGPGGGLTDRLRDQTLSALRRKIPLVIDADALSVFADEPETLFKALHDQVVLTPHGGEFARLFPEIAGRSDLNKIEKTRQAAQQSGAVIVHKGPDTVIAAPTGAVRVNVHASPALATMGTGDILAGLIGALMAQGAAAFDAASAAVWIQGEAGRRCGPGATALVVLDRLPAALADIHAMLSRRAALRRVRQNGG